MDALERIRRGYRAIGPGEPRDMLAMFHQERPDPPEWVVDDSLRIMPARDVVAMDLFAGALPSHWEIIGVDLLRWQFHTKKSRLVVAGRFRTRPKGAWEVVRLPFIHVWSVDDEEVQGVFDYFAGIEVKRRASLPPRRGWRFWRWAAR